MADEPKTPETSDTTPDLNHPAVQAAIQAASSKAVAEAEKRFGARLDEEIKGLKSNNAEIKAEKKKLQEELEAARLKAAATEHGVDPDKVHELAKKEAERLAEIRRREFAEELAAEKAAREKAETKGKELEAKARRLSISGLVPWDSLLDSPDVRDIVLRRLDPLVTFQEKDGAEVPILMRDGEVIPGTVSDLLTQAREGKGHLGTLSAFFRSNGKGSGTTSANGSAPSARVPSKMSVEERVAFIAEHGLQEFKDLVDRHAA